MSGKKVESSKKPYCVCRFGLDSIDSNCQKNWYECLSTEGRNAFQLFAAGTTQSVCSYGVCVSPIGNEFWDFIGGVGTYAQFIDAVNAMGKNYHERIYREYLGIEPPHTPEDYLLR